MSDLATRMPGMFNPWRVLRGLPSITVLRESEDGLIGSWDERERTIRIHPTANQAERRCTLAHELIHAERGDTECDWRVHREAARRLIDIHALADAAAFHGDDLEALADELWVDLDTLNNRLQHLHPAERGYLTRRLSTKEASA